MTLKWGLNCVEIQGLTFLASWPNRGLEYLFLCYDENGAGVSNRLAECCMDTLRNFYESRLPYKFICATASVNTIFLGSHRYPASWGIRLGPYEWVKDWWYLRPVINVIRRDADYLESAEGNYQTTIDSETLSYYIPRGEHNVASVQTPLWREQTNAQRFGAADRFRAFGDRY